ACCHVEVCRVMVAMQSATRSFGRCYGLVTLELSTISGRPVKKSNADVRMTEEDEKVSEIDELGWHGCSVGARCGIRCAQKHASCKRTVPATAKCSAPHALR